MAGELDEVAETEELRRAMKIDYCLRCNWLQLRLHGGRGYCVYGNEPGPGCHFDEKGRWHGERG